ncbi:MAG: carboxypeptidase-like regulatory domain-containing protein, partial [Acidobacteriota bacterium]
MQIRSVWIAAFLALPLGAQEYRATLLGVVSDPSGAAVVGAAVKVTNIESGVVATSSTNQEGTYVIPYLLPGRYSLQVEQSGFRSFERSPIELRVNDRTRLDVTLELGQLSDRVTVTAEAPLLEVSSGSRGQSIEARKITALPLRGMNPLTFINLAAGVQYTGSLGGFGPSDVSTMSSWSINGGRPAMNEVQIDGVSDHAIKGGGQVIAYVPPLEAVQELKIQTNTYDAQYGRTGGGVVTMSVKPGTNTFHGAVYEFLRRTALVANTFANNANSKPRTQSLSDQYGFEVDGPIWLPKLYRGKDRTFFMFSLERSRSVGPSPYLTSVPTPEQRKGDFSQTFTSARQMYTIYDPLTVRPNPAFDPARAVSLSNPQYLRTPFAGNLVPPGRMNPLALRVLQDIPLPNQSGDPVTRVNNWFAGSVVGHTDFKNIIARVDHNISSAWRIYGRWNHNFRDGGHINYNGWDTPARREEHLGRENHGAVFDTVGTLSPQTIVSMRIGFNRFFETNFYNPYDMSQLGLPKTLIGQLQMPNKYPVFSFENYEQTSRSEADIVAGDTYTAQGNMMKIVGRHSMKFGTEYRLIHFANFGRGNAMGTYSFTRSWTYSNPQVNDPMGGNAIASFLLGYMASASATLNATPYLSSHYPVAFYQDDWQATRRLTLTLGIRWDLERPWVERYNRQNRGFDFGAKSPYQIPGLDLRGGLLFAGVGGQPRTAFEPDRNNWQPRAGLAYKVVQGSPLVFRAGMGRYYLPTVEYGGNTGFAQTTNAQTSTPGFLPFQTLSDPFPNGLIQPPGASRGLATQVGDSVSFGDPRRVVPYVWQYSAGFQYELVPGLLAEASYVGSRTRELQVGKSMSYLTKEQLALGTPYLSQVVPNPFYGVLPASTSRGAQSTTQRRNLMTQFPQFSGLTMSSQSIGESWYSALQIKVERRYRQGLTFLVSYTISKTMEKA